MPPKNKFTREEIINTAFDIFRTSGLSYVTARNIAEKLNTSTSPIYSYFTDMDELTGILFLKTNELITSYMKNKKTNSPFINMGIGLIEFSRKEKILFNALFNNEFKNKNLEKKEFQMMHDEYLEIMMQDSTLKGLSKDSLERILIKMRVFTIGLSMFVNQNIPPFDNINYDIDLMIETAKILIKEENNHNI